MAKRYGRNQKRRHREQITNLEVALRWKQSEVNSAKHEAREARSKALNEFIEGKGLYEHLLGEMSYGVGRGLGEELAKHKTEIMKVVEKSTRGPMLKFAYDNEIADRPVNVVTVHIPLREIYYRKIV